MKTKILAAGLSFAAFASLNAQQKPFPKMTMVGVTNSCLTKRITGYQYPGLN